MRCYIFSLLLLLALRAEAQLDLRPRYYLITLIKDYKALIPPFVRVFGKDPKTITTADFRDELMNRFGESKPLLSHRLLRATYPICRIVSFTVSAQIGDRGSDQQEYLGPFDVAISLRSDNIADSDEGYVSLDVLNLLRHLAAKRGTLFLEDIRAWDAGYRVRRRLNDVIIILR